MDQGSGDKKGRLEQALERGTAMVHLDARKPGVQVPSRFGEDHHLRLNLSLNFPPHDLSLDDWGVRQTLSFNAVPFPVALPWSAIFAITGQKAEQAWLFPEDMPKELFESAARHFGLTGDEVVQLEQEASQTPVLDLKPPRSAARRFTPRVVNAPTDGLAEPERPEQPERPSERPVEAGEAGPAASEPCALEAKAAPRRGHLRLVK